MAFGFAVLSAAASPSTRAASPAEWKDCDSGYPASKKIAACTRIIRRSTESTADRIKALKQRAYGHYFKEDFKSMLADLDETVRLGPDDAENYRFRGHMRQDIGDLDGAIVDYGEAIRVKPDAWYHQYRGDLYRRKGDEKRAIADYTEALRIYDADHAKNPAYFHYYGRSQVNRELGRFDEALRDYGQFLKSQKEWYAHQVMEQGDLHLNKGDVDRAILDYSEVIRREPDDENAHFRRALAYRAKGDYAAAIADYNKIMSGYGRDNPDALNGRGLAYAASGRLDAAVRDFSRAIELFDEDAMMFYNRAQAYRLLGRNDTALRDYGMAIGLDPKNAVIFNSRALAYLAAGDRERALADLDEAMRLDDKFAVPHFNRGTIRHTAKQYDLAIQDYEGAIARDAAQAEYFVARGVAHAAKGAHDRAVADFTAALRLEPVNASFYVARASARLKAGRRDAALDDANRALLIDRNLSAAYAVRADIHAAMGKADLAAADRRSAGEMRGRSPSADQTRVTTAKDTEAAQNRAPSAARFVLSGSFPIDGGGGVNHELYEVVVEVKGGDITYRRGNFLNITARSGGRGTATFPVKCSNRPTDLEGDRTLSATLSGRQIQLNYESRFDFASGPCRNMYNHREETISITASDEGCRFSYSESTNVKNAGAPVRGRVAIKDQRCVTELFEP